MRSEALKVWVAARPAITNAINDGMFVESSPRLIHVCDHETGRIIANKIPEISHAPIKIIKPPTIATKYFI